MDAQQCEETYISNVQFAADLAKAVRQVLFYQAIACDICLRMILCAFNLFVGHCTVVQEGITIMVEAVNSIITCPGYFVDTPDKGKIDEQLERLLHILMDTTV